MPMFVGTNKQHSGYFLFEIPHKSGRVIYVEKRIKVQYTKNVVIMVRFSLSSVHYTYLKDNTVCNYCKDDINVLQPTRYAKRR
jgi:hypothetical protein